MSSLGHIWCRIAHSPYKLSRPVNCATRCMQCYREHPVKWHEPSKPVVPQRREELVAVEA